MSQNPLKIWLFYGKNALQPACILGCGEFLLQWDREPVERLVTVLLSSVEIVHRECMLQGIHPALIL